MMGLPIIIHVVRIFQWSAQKWETDEMGTFQAHGIRTFTGKRTNPEATPCLQKPTEEEWKKLKSMWLEQTG